MSTGPFQASHWFRGSAGCNGWPLPLFRIYTTVTAVDVATLAGLLNNMSINVDIGKS